MKNLDIEALRDENTMMISEIHKKDRIIDELAKQNQDLTKQNQYMAKQNQYMTKQMQDLARRITYYENAHSPPSQNSMPARHSKAQRRTPDRAPAARRGVPGRRKGHNGARYTRKPDRIVRHRPQKCGLCGGTDLTDVGRARTYTSSNRLSYAQCHTILIQRSKRDQFHTIT